MNTESPSKRGPIGSLFAEHHRPKSIRRKIRNTFFLMIIIPFITISAAAAIVGRIYYGESFSHTPNRVHESVQKPDPNDIRLLNEILNDSAQKLFNNATLSPFYSEHPLRFAVTYKNEEAVAISPPMTLELFKELKLQKVKHAPRLFSAWEWSFKAGRIVFFQDRDPFTRGPFWFLLVLALFTISVNAVATHRISKHITRPLEGLEKAAARIGDGDLEFSLKAEGAEEVIRLYSSFEEMRKRLKASLEKQAAEEKSRKELIAAISHDLRTPITSIRGHIEGLKDNIPKTEEDRSRYLDIIEKQTRILDDMIHNLFLYSKLEIDEIPLNTERTQLQGYVSSLVSNYLQTKYPAGKTDNLPPRIEIQIEETIEWDIDQIQFKRIIENIIDNSIVYNRGADLVITVSAIEDQGNCIICISDNGTGIRAENAERIFDVMFREDESRNREGSGLGLAIVKKLTAAHGGSVKAYNNPDRKGLTIELVLQQPGDRR